MPSSYASPEYTHCIREARFRSNVYEPEADTFLFLEALDKDADLLRQLSPRRCIEIGCGSGTVITHLRCLLMLPSVSSDADTAKEEGKVGENASSSEAMSLSTAAAVGGPLFCAVDVNPLALEATGVTWTDTLLKYFSSPLLSNHFAKAFHCDTPSTLAAPVVINDTAAVSTSAGDAVEMSNATSSSSSSTYCLRRFQGDLFDAVRGVFHPEVAPIFDVILFNPPYVPTSLEELENAVALKDVITAAWCGGPRGRVVLDRFLCQLPRVMSRCGAAYIVLIKENQVEDVVNFTQRQFRARLRELGFFAGEGEEDVVEAVEVAARYTGEHLSVYRLRYLPRFRYASATL